MAFYGTVLLIIYFGVLKFPYRGTYPQRSTPLIFSPVDGALIPMDYHHFVHQSFDKLSVGYPCSDTSYLLALFILRMLGGGLRCLLCLCRPLFGLQNTTPSTSVRYRMGLGKTWSAVLDQKSRVKHTGSFIPSFVGFEHTSRRCGLAYTCKK